MPSLEESRGRLGLRSKESKPPKGDPKKEDVKSKAGEEESKATELYRVSSDDSTSSIRNKGSGSSG